jgi:Zn-finger nucleic acid-binding protein
MMRHFFSIKKQVEIDECAGCAGIWLDTGELSEIRSLFDSEEARHQAAEKVFSDLFGPQLEALAKEREANAERAKRIANMFKFLCPSYYLPGKQKWGAF